VSPSSLSSAKILDDRSTYAIHIDRSWPRMRDWLKKSRVSLLCKPSEVMLLEIQLEIFASQEQEEFFRGCRRLTEERLWQKRSPTTWQYDEKSSLGCCSYISVAMRGGQSVVHQTSSHLIVNFFIWRIRISNEEVLQRVNDTKTMLDEKTQTCVVRAC